MQVEALAVRLGCRLVKVSPGGLAAAAGVQADRYGQPADPSQLKPSCGLVASLPSTLRENASRRFACIPAPLVSRYVGPLRNWPILGEPKSAAHTPDLSEKCGSKYRTTRLRACLETETTYAPPPSSRSRLCCVSYQGVDGGVSLLPSVRVEPGAAASRFHGQVRLNGRGEGKGYTTVTLSSFFFSPFAPAFVDR